MKAGDLKLITMAASVEPRLLPHMITIYKLGYKQAQIDQLKDKCWGIDYGREVLNAN